MVEFTLFEVHLDGAQLTANAPFSSANPEDAEDADWTELEPGTDGDGGEDGDGGGPNPLAVVFAVVTAVVLAVVIRKVLGGDESPEE